MNEPLQCEHNGESAKTPYHYTECGLENVYLVSGYDSEDDAELGTMVYVRDADKLHCAIGEWLVRNKKVLSGNELRFLRKEMNLTQAELGSLLGMTDQAVARWEKEKHDISGPADYLIRALFIDHLGLPNGAQIRSLITELEGRDASATDETQSFEQGGNGWRPTALAA